MEIRPWIIGVVATVCTASGLVAQEDKVVHVVVGVKSAIVYCPPRYNPLRRYPFIMAIPGAHQSVMEAFRVWQPIAADMGYILMCPSMSIEPRVKITDDDRQVLVGFRNYLDRNYRVDASTSLVVGIGTGANLAMETAMVYPRKFRNMMAFYGFFNQQVEPVLRNYVRKQEYQYSEFILVTSDGDPSQNSLTHFADMLQDLGVESELIVYPDLMQGYPMDLRAVMGRIHVKVAENAKKELKH